MSGAGKSKEFSGHADKPTWRKAFDFFIGNTFYLDYRSMALYRVAMAMYVLSDLFWRGMYMTEHYSWFGQYPMSLGSAGTELRFSLHLINGSLPFLTLMFVIAWTFGIMLLIGYKTRLSAFMSYVLLASLQNRNIYILDGSDDYVRVMLFWLIFLPCSKVYSIDSLKIQPTPTNNHENNNASSANGITNYRHLSFSTVGFIVQFSTIYIFTALLKHGDDWHVTYDAVHYALNLKEFNYGLTDFLVQFPEFLRLLTRVTLAFEYLGPILMISPIFNTQLRLLSVFGFIGMHIGFGVCINIYLFIVIPMVCSCGFLPTPFWEFVLSKIQSNNDRIHLSIFYDGRSKNVEFMLFAFKKFFLIPQTPIIKIANNSSFSGASSSSSSFDRDEDDVGIYVSEFEPTNEQLKSKYFSVQFHGESYTDYDAFVVMVSQSWLLWPLEIVVNSPFFEKIFNKFHIFVDWLNNSNSEYNLNRYKAPSPSSSSSPSSKSMLSKTGKILLTIVIPLIFILYVPYWNYNGWHRQKDPMYPAPYFASIAYVFKADQWWGMFAPNPPKYSRWLVIPANFEKYTGIDLLFDEPKAADYIADPIYTFNSGQRQRNFLMSVLFHEDLRLHYGRYICRTWNIYSPDPERGRLKSFKIVAVQRNTRLPYDKTPPEYFKEDIWIHTC